MIKTGKTIVMTLLALLWIGNVQADELNSQTYSIKQNLLKVAVKNGLKPHDIVEAMKSKAVEMNMKLVGHQPISRELAARGIKSGSLEIMQFCNPYDARTMVKSNPLFAAYMPCRIALVEDDEKKLWLLMLDLDVLIDDTPLPLATKKTAARINESMKAILKAGSTGEF